MKTVTTILIVTLIFLFLAKTKISFSPFQVQMKDWKLSLGLFIILLGVAVINMHYYNKGLKEGSDQVFRLVKMMKQQKENSHE